MCDSATMFQLEKILSPGVLPATSVPHSVAIFYFHGAEIIGPVLTSSVGFGRMTGLLGGMGGAAEDQDMADNVLCTPIAL